MTHPLLQIEPAGSGRRISVLATVRQNGDMHPQRVGRDVLRDRQLAITGDPWWMLDQVHGVDSWTVPNGAPIDAVAAHGDVLVADRANVDLAVWVADCAPLVLIGDTGAVVAAHGGWRGLADGVVDVALDKLSEVANQVAAAVLGPVIHPGCYEFDAADLERVAAGVHADVAAIGGQTSWGSLALDVPAAVAAALERSGVTLDVVGPCTGCDDRWYSHRCGAEPERHAVVASIRAVA